MIRFNDGTVLVIRAITSISQIKVDEDTGEYYFELGCGGLLFKESNYDKKRLTAIRERILTEVRYAC